MIMKRRKTMNKPSKWQSQIDITHREWCRENGYPVNWYRPKQGRPKINKRASEQADNLNALNSENFVNYKKKV